MQHSFFHRRRGRVAAPAVGPNRAELERAEEETETDRPAAEEEEGRGQSGAEDLNPECAGAAEYATQASRPD
eukprot:4115872-Pyramimonas_sp.AAC.1